MRPRAVSWGGLLGCSSEGEPAWPPPSQLKASAWGENQAYLQDVQMTHKQWSANGTSLSGRFFYVLALCARPATTAPAHHSDCSMVLCTYLQWQQVATTRP